MFRELIWKIPVLRNRLPSLVMFKDPTQYKYRSAWFKSRRENYLLKHALPWLTFDAVHYLENHIKQGSRVFEYGSGSSTLFWMRFKAHCVSIEHDPAWYALIKQWL